MSSGSSHRMSLSSLVKQSVTRNNIEKNKSVNSMKKKNISIIGAFLAAFGGICWGLSGSMGQYLFTTELMDSRWLVPIRLGLAGLLLLTYCALRYPGQIWNPWKHHQDRIELIIYGLAGVSCCQFLYFLTIQLSSAGIATILQDLSPIIILMISCLSGRRLPRITEIIAIALALIGVFLITTHGNLRLSISVYAILTGVLSAVCVTIYNVVPTRLMKSYPVLLLQGWAFIMGCVFLGIIFHPWTYHYVPSAMGLFGILFVVVVGNVIAFPCYLKGVHLIGPEKSILWGFSEPLTAALIAVWILGNPFTIWDGIGFAAIFGMLVLISCEENRT